MIRSALFVGAIVASSPAWSAFNNQSLASVPTLDRVGLGALITLVAGVAGWAVRKRSGRK